MAGTTGSANTIKASATTLEILEGLRELNGAGVTELANHLDMSKSNVHNYLNTLRREEYVVKDGSKYDVGLRFLGLSRYARKKQEIYNVACPELDGLAEETGELVNLLIEEHGRGVYLYQAEGPKSVEVDSSIGYRVYLHNTALGKTILAELDRDRVDGILDRHGLPSTTERTITDREELHEELERVRERGVAFDREERLQGLNCVACSIADNQGTVAGAISVSGPASRMSGDRLESDLPEKLQSVSNIVSLNLTYS